MDHARPSRRRKKAPGKPLDSNGLRELALSYVARFATTSGRLGDYLRRKIRERGWCGEDQARIDELVEEFVHRGYIDDESWARSRAAGLAARGYGARRIDQSLRAAGIEEEVRADSAPDAAAARKAAVGLARRRRFGPFGEATDGEDDRKRSEKQLAAMVRAGHDFADARRVIDAASQGELEAWIGEAEEDCER